MCSLYKSRDHKTEQGLDEDRDLLGRKIKKLLVEKGRSNRGGELIVRDYQGIQVAEQREQDTVGSQRRRQEGREQGYIHLYICHI